MKKMNTGKGLIAFLMLIVILAVDPGQILAGILDAGTGKLPGSVSENRLSDIVPDVSENSTGIRPDSVSGNILELLWGSVSDNRIEPPFFSISENTADFMEPDWMRKGDFMPGTGERDPEEKGCLDEWAALKISPADSGIDDPGRSVSEDSVGADKKAVSDNTTKKDVVNVELPGDYLFYINPDGRWDDSEQQIYSEEYEIVNHSNVDVRIRIHPYVVGGDFEWVEKAPEDGKHLEMTDRDKKGAVYLVYRVGDHEIVMSKETTETYEVILKSADNDGNAVQDGRLAISFAGNVDPEGSYPEGEMRIRVDYSFEPAK